MHFFTKDMWRWPNSLPFGASKDAHIDSTQCFGSRARVLWDSDKFRYVSVFEQLLRDIEWESLRSADLHTALTVTGVMLFSSRSISHSTVFVSFFTCRNSNSFFIESLQHTPFSYEAEQKRESDSRQMKSHVWTPSPRYQNQTSNLIVMHTGLLLKLVIYY